MVNILIKDLDTNQELDKKAMSNIFGGWANLTNVSTLYEAAISKETLGIFIDMGNGTMSQKFKETYYRVVKGERIYSEIITSAAPTPAF